MVRVHLSTLLGRKRWSQKYFSEITGIRYNTINDLYHEMSISVKLEHIDIICKTLDCRGDELIEYIPDKKTKK